MGVFKWLIIVENNVIYFELNDRKDRRRPNERFRNQFVAGYT